MDDQFELPVQHNGRDVSFKSVLVRHGFIYKFHVDVNGTVVIFEPDEEKNYIAIASPADRNKDFDKSLLQAIAATIEKLVN